MRYVAIGGPWHEQDLEIPDNVRKWIVLRAIRQTLALTEGPPAIAETIPYERHVYRPTQFQAGPEMPRRYYARYESME